MDRDAMAEACLQIEKKGGNVLEYLKEHGCISPWGTWHRLQIEQLGRKECEITDGKGKAVKEMRKILMTDEVRAEAIRISLTGGDPAVYLKSVGFKNPVNTWSQIRKALAVTDPDTYAQIPDRRKVKTDATATAQITPVEHELTVSVAGTQILPEADTMPAAEAREYHADMITQPLKFMGYTVTQLERPDLGEFHFDRRHNLIEWTSPDRLETVSLDADFARKLIREAPTALSILGVDILEVDPDA